MLIDYIVFIIAIAAVLGYRIYQRVRFDKALKEHPNMECALVNERYKLIYPVFIIVIAVLIFVIVNAENKTTAGNYTLLLMLVVGLMVTLAVMQKVNQNLYYNKDGFITTTGYHRYRDIKKLEKNGSMSYRIQYFTDKKMYPLPGKVGEALNKVRKDGRL